MTKEALVLNIILRTVHFMKKYVIVITLSQNATRMENIAGE